LPQLASLRSALLNEPGFASLAVEMNSEEAPESGKTRVQARLVRRRDVVTAEFTIALKVGNAESRALGLRTVDSTVASVQKLRKFLVADSTSGRSTIFRDDINGFRGARRFGEFHSRYVLRVRDDDTMLAF
jgi:hypothetical protein